MPNGEPVAGSLYFYAPVKVGPIIFAIAFLSATVFHIWQCNKYKAWKIMSLHPFGALLFTLGFAARAYGTWHYDDIKAYIISTILIYSAPPILELANYHVLGRILYYVPYCAPLHPGRTLTTFGFLSLIVELTNAFGVAWLMHPTIDGTRQDIGLVLMKLSLIVQICVIALFAIIAGIFHRRCIKAGIKIRNVQGPLLTMYISTGVILVRTIYRTIEHFSASRIPASPPDNWDPRSLSPVVRYEWFFWVFEATPMLFNSFLWNSRHPRMYLPQDYHIYIAQDGRTELVGPGWKDDRPWFMTWIDPFGFVGSNKNKERPFWETNGFDKVPLLDMNTGSAKTDKHGEPAGHAEPAGFVEESGHGRTPHRVGESAV